MPNFAQVGARGLVRKRLLDELDGLRGGPLALVVAPAGFGKTTLLSHYAHAFDGVVCWLSATPVDADPAAFTARVREAAGWPGEGSDLHGLFAGHRDDARQVLLVIDDAHYLEGSETEAALGRLLVASPPHLHTALGSRRMPGLNLYRHELSGLVVIDADRLRFRSWEAEELLRDVYREPLPPAEVAALARRLGGWVAGLHMFHLSTRGRPLAQRRAAVAAMDGRAALSRAYLARTVLAELPDGLREFLVRTTVFDVVTAQRCNRLLGTRDSHGHLESLERLQAFTTSHDGGRTYRYHEVMRACLAVTLADEWGDDAARDWYAKAAALLEAEGALAEATRAYARAEDWLTVRRLLDRIGAGIVDDAVESWSEVLPEWLVAEDPWLVLAEGRHLLSRGQLTAAIEHFGHAEALFTHEDGRAHCRAALARATRWLPGPSLPGPALTAQVGGPWAPRHVADWAGLLRAATKRHPAMLAAQAGQRVAGGDAPPNAARCAQVLGHVLAGDAARAAQLLAEADGADPHAPTLPGLALSLLHAAADLALGEASAANRLADVAAEAERRGWPWLTRMARAAVALDQTEQSAKAARAVAEECGREGDSWGEVLASGLAWLPHAGRTGSGTVELGDLVRKCRQLDAGVLEAWFHGLFAVAAAVAHLPDADVEAARAASMAQAAGVPGAAVAALAAQACLSGTAAAVAATRAAARDAGLPDALVSAWVATVPDHGVAGVRTPTDARLTVQCLGGFAVQLDGARVDWSAVRPRARVLMRLLALHTGRLVHREALCEALWPDLTQAAATHNLHVAMSSLRKLLDPGSGRGQSRLLVRDGDAYGLALPADGYCDVAAVRAALDQARTVQLTADRLAALRAAVAGYTGDLLPEDGAAEWVVHEREDLRHAVAAAAATLATLELSTGDTGAALAAAERGVAIDRYSDEGWRLLIGAHERDNDLGAASRARLRYADMLIELGVDPVAQLAGVSPSPTLARPTPTTRTVAGT